METVKQILTKYNGLRRVDYPSITFEEIEKIVNFKLPEDYRSFLQCYHGFEGFIREEFVHLWTIDNIIDANRSYRIFENLSNTLAIGGNGNGEFIALDLMTSGNFRIVLSPFVDLDIQYHITIGDSFSDFLERLDNGQKWFD